MIMSQSRHVQIVRSVRVEVIPSEAQRGLFYWLRDQLATIAQDGSWPGPWRKSCEEAWEVLTKDKRTVY